MKSFSEFYEKYPNLAFVKTNIDVQEPSQLTDEVLILDEDTPPLEHGFSIIVPLYNDVSNIARCLEYIVGGKKDGILIAFRVIYIIAVAFGPYLTVSAVWNIADIFNGLMAIPNLIALVMLSSVVRKETNIYFNKQSNRIIKK